MPPIRKLAPPAAMALLFAAGWFLLRPSVMDAPAIRFGFVDEAQRAGAANLHQPCTLAPDFANIMPWLTAVGAAVAAGDADGDGWVDFYVTNNQRNSPNRLFRNNRDGTFTDIAAAAGVRGGNETGAVMDAVFFDCDNDGDQDLLLARWAAPLLLWLNRGDGIFSAAAPDTALDFRGYPSAVCVLDYDRDGRLDLYIGNYFADTVEDPHSGRSVPNDLWHPVTTRVMHETTINARNGGRNLMLRNLGAGRFAEVTGACGLEYTGWTLDVGHGDLNNDGWPDIYVANDYGPDRVYINQGRSGAVRFEPVTDPKGHPGLGRDWWKGMNVDMADIDGNGFLDIYVANILVPGHIVEGNMLWMGTGDDRMPGGVRYRNRSQATGTMDGGWGWGARFGDFNNDGRTDIYAANGFISGRDEHRTYWFALQELSAQHRANMADAAHWLPLEDLDLAGHQRDRLFLQVPRRRAHTVPSFIDVAPQAGLGARRDGRGVATCDYDRDGDLDLYVTNQKAPSALYRNTLLDHGAAGGHWMGFRLRGDPDHPLARDGHATASSRDAFGARVTVFTPKNASMQQLAPTNGFSSQSEARLHFGLGDAAGVDSVRVDWPSGRHRTLPGRLFKAGCDHLLTEGEGEPAVLPAPLASGGSS